jgi:hypothetical protein
MVTKTRKPAIKKNAITLDCDIYIPTCANAVVPVLGNFTPTKYPTTKTKSRKIQE